jgi:hypothetical protein
MLRCRRLAVPPPPKTPRQWREDPRPIPNRSSVVRRGQAALSFLSVPVAHRRQGQTRGQSPARAAGLVSVPHAKAGRTPHENAVDASIRCCQEQGQWTERITVSHSETTGICNLQENGNNNDGNHKGHRFPSLFQRQEANYRYFSDQLQNTQM